MIRSRPYFVLLAGAFLWCLSIVALPLLATTDHALARAISSFLQETFSKICHRMPERSFHLNGEPLGVCIRCTWIYGGFLLGTLLYPAYALRFGRRVPPRWFLIAAAMPTGLDAIFNILGLMVSTEASRAVTGGVLGLVLPAYVAPLLIEAWAEFSRRRAAPRRTQTEIFAWTNDRTSSASPSSVGRLSEPSRESPV